MKKVTLTDIAKASGVSIATVSRVLSNKDKVKKETYELVMKNAKAYKYQYQSKDSSSTDAKIMLICGDITSQAFQSIIGSAVSLFNKHGYKASVYYSEYQSDIEEDYVRFAHRDNYKGILLLSAMETTELIKLLSKKTCPVVLVNRFIRSMDLAAVCMDNFRGGYMATSYLIDKGHKYIAHLGGPVNSTTSQDRLRGYQKAMYDAGLPITDDAVFIGDLSYSSGYKFGEHFINNMKNFTAVFCSNDAMTAGFINKLSEYNLRIPDDLSCICFDDTPLVREGPVKLTTVSRDSDAMGIVAAEMMIEMITTGNEVKRKVVFPPILHERDSVKSIL